MKRREFIRNVTIGFAAYAAGRPVRAEGVKYRVAVIGRTGRGDYGHGLDVVWNGIDQAHVVAVADEDAKGRAAAAKRLKAPNAYADYRRMLEKERPQIVSVAPRWLDCHHEMALACAEHGCHVFLEKPMCPTLAQADEMIAAFEKRGLKLAIAHQTRYSPTLEHVQKLIADGRFGDILELRGRGKEDRRGGGEDLMVLGTHIMDLMRLFAGDAQWCFAQVNEAGKPVTKSDVRDGAEGIGPLAGDEIHAMYRVSQAVSRASRPRSEGGTPSAQRGQDGRDTGTPSPPAMAYFSTCRARHGAPTRFGLQIFASKGILTMTTGALPAVWFVEDPSWQPGTSKALWHRITSGGIDKPETLSDAGQSLGNRLIALDLIRAIETDTQPKGSIYDGRAALEMILAVYESHRLKGPVTLPLRSRVHPLTLL
jgi:predicted dehydrogenase